MRQGVPEVYQTIYLSINLSDLSVNLSQAGFALTASDGQGLGFQTAHDAGAIFDQS
ncbi:MAG: hypothetical protein ACI94O_002139 [Octadecabacter sp.]|jgi:hypothetical protein